MEGSARTLIRDVTWPAPGAGFMAGDVLLESGRIAACGRVAMPPQFDGTVIDGGGRLLTPGLIDLHTHGIGRNLYERSENDLIDGAAMLPRFGTTCVLPTLYRVLTRPLDHLERLAAALPKVRGAAMPGFHLEGPFLALPGAGARTIPGDVQLLEHLLDACRGRVAAMSVSPDTPNILAVIKRLVERKVAVFLTHTRASVEQTLAALDAGARHATHFYDVFPLPNETDAGVRPVGAVEAILADERASVDFIPDGVHVHPAAIKLAVAAKGWRGVSAITDSNIGAGLPPGRYDTPWGFAVRVAPDDAARIADESHPGHGQLAGSSLTMDAAMRNLMRWLNPLPAEQVWSMGTANPARVASLSNRGVIEAGSIADLVLWNQDVTATKTWVGGELVYCSTD